MFRKLTPKITFFLTLALLIALAGTALVQAAVRTDKPDYLPGSPVTISGDNSDGAGYIPGETVTVAVTGPNGYTAACEGVANDAGAWSCQVTLVNDYSAVGSYSYIAVGLTSGVKETGYFTDDPGAKVKFATAGLPNGTSVSVIYSGNNNGGKPISGSDTFTSPGPSGGTSFDAASSVTFTFPPEIVSGGKSYRFVNSDVSSPATAGAPQSSMTITGTYEIACTAPSITAQPANVTKTLGETATFSVTASGTSLTYQWQKDGNPITGANNQTYTINSVSSGDAGNYTVVIGSACGSITSNPAALTFIKADQTITFGALANKIYGDADFGVSATTTSGQLVTFSASGNCTISGSTVHLTGSGSCAITASADGSNDYIAATPVTQSFSIAKASQSITFAALSGKTYGDAPFGVSASASSGLPVNFAASGQCSISGATVTITGAGNCEITASQAGNDNFNAAANVKQSFAIAQRPVTVTADAKSKTYGDADPALTYQVTAGNLVNGDAFTGALTRDSGETVGDYAINQSTLALNSNYALTYNSANLTITQRSVTVTADPQTKIYGDADPVLTYQVTAGNLVGNDTFTGSLARSAGEGVGPYAITQGTLALSGNYNLSFVGANLTITQRPITVIAESQTKVYGDVDPAFTYQITSGSLAFSDAFSGVLARDPGETVGDYAITQGTLALNGNYALTFVNGNLTITKRPVTVTANVQTKVFGEADPALTYNVTSGNLVGTDALTGALTRDAGENVGIYAITQGTLALDSNYALTFVGANLSINARPITITADAKTKVYGNADPAFTYQITSGNLIGTDSFTGTLARAAGEKVGVYAITQGNVVLSSNYTLTFVPANLDITARPITITADPKSKVYGDADPALTYQITTGSLAFSDAFSGSLARVAGENVSAYAISQGTLDLGSNYKITFVGANLTITARPITVTADAKSKVYGEDDPALTYKITSGSLAYSDTFSGALTRDAGENVGDYAITQGTLALSTNYDLTYVGDKLTITQRPVTVSAYLQTKVYGDPDPILTYHITDGTLVSGDDFTGSLTRAAGENVGLYAINQGTLTLGTNYNLTFVSGNLTITQRPVTVTADNKTKILGAVDPSLTYQVTSGSLVGTDAFSGSLTRTPGETVGSYDILQGTLTLGGNYNLSFVSAKLTIVYDFPGFLQPINDTAHTRTCPGTCTLSVFKAGSTVPVKFQILDASGKPVQAATNPIFMKPISGGSITMPVDETASYATADSSMTFRWDTTSQQYIYNWSTKGLKAGIWYVIGVTLDDGKQYVVIIGLK